MKASHYLINATFAKANNLPVSFIAIRAKETQKAVWMYGHGAMDPSGRCAACGRTLTHPGSILIGIGPECLGNWGARDIRLENMTEADKVYLKSLVTERKVDSWIPKSVIKETTAVEEEIQLPEAHKASQASHSTGPVVKKTEEITKKAREWKNQIAIQFPYSYETLTKVKSLEGRRYHGEGKYWTCPIKVHSIKQLKEWGFALDNTLSMMIDALEEGQERVMEVEKANLQNLGLKKELFPYQKEGVAFIHSRKGRALVGDEMGLGKTIQALAYLQLRPELRPALILCPASLKLNWAKEIKETMTKGIKTQILEGKTPYRINGDILIINYDILPSWQKALQGIPKIIIADECHYFKSNSALRTKAVKFIAKGCPHFIALSGTPIVNRPIEIYNALSIINPSVIPNFWNYARRYCGAVHNGFGWDFSGASHTDELHKILTETVMIRRKKADVLKDLPDKIHSFVPMSLNNQSEYDSIESDVIEYLRKTKGEKAADKASNAEIVVQIEHLKQAAVKGKLNSAIDWINEFLESSDEKLIVFATHKFVIDKLMHTFSSDIIPNTVVKIDGSTSMVDRNTAVELFQNNPKTRLIIGNIKAAGVGLTLTAASNVAFIELPWTPGDLQQAEDRAHRIGQKDTVNVHFLLVPGTIEEKIAQLLDKKTKVLDAVLDGKETKQESLLQELMKMITRSNYEYQF